MLIIIRTAVRFLRRARRSAWPRKQKDQSMAFAKLKLKLQGPAAVITLDNPPVNALHPGMSVEIVQALEQIASVAAVRGVVITGRGRHFVAGGDINFFTTLDARTAEAYALGIQQMQSALQALDRPVIAAVNGHALGGGCELMMACDIRIADETAMFGQPEVRLGLMPGAGGTQHLPRLIPVGHAKRLLFTGRQVGAAAAQAMGLIDEVVPAGQCLAAALALIEEIAACAPLAVAQIKRAVNLGLTMSAPDGHRLEAALFGELFRTEDVREGVNAFLTKRRPDFKGR
jgi:enoyl-CoA hydratase/carnithine racemase